MTKPTPSCSQCYQMPKVAPLFVLAGVKSQLRDPILTLVCASFVFGTLQTQARADLLYFGTGNAVVELDPSTFNVESFFLVPPSLGNIEGIAAANGLVAVTTPDSVSEYSSNGTLLEQASAPNGGDVSFLSEGASVPEPSTAMSFIVGAVGILAFKLRRSSRYRSEAS